MGVVPSLEGAAYRLQTAAEASLDVVSAVLTPDDDFEFLHVGFSPLEKPKALLLPYARNTGRENARHHCRLRAVDYRFALLFPALPSYDRR